MKVVGPERLEITRFTRYNVAGFCTTIMILKFGTGSEYEAAQKHPKWREVGIYFTGIGPFLPAPTLSSDPLYYIE